MGAQSPARLMGAQSPETNHPWPDTHQLKGGFARVSQDRLGPPRQTQVPLGAVTSAPSPPHAHPLVTFPPPLIQNDHFNARRHGHAFPQTQPGITSTRLTSATMQRKLPSPCAPCILGSLGGRPWRLTLGKKLVFFLTGWYSPPPPSASMLAHAIPTACPLYARTRMLRQRRRLAWTGRVPNTPGASHFAMTLGPCVDLPPGEQNDILLLALLIGGAECSAKP
jgi:hypothetical protein